jgi:DNA-3-methyladenine glycosylase
MKLKLEQEYYLNEDVLEISRNLLGKFLATQFNGNLTSGMIIETEAYKGINDKASHAYNNRRTKRNEVMYAEGGICYVYLCYGIHHLFNVVTNKNGIPDAVLIRAILPGDGINIMLERRNHKSVTKKISDGPGTASQALAIHTGYSGEPLTGNTIWIEDRGVNFKSNDIQAGPRIGVAYAKEDALLPYRFRLNETSIKELSNR